MSQQQHSQIMPHALGPDPGGPAGLRDHRDALLCTLPSLVVHERAEMPHVPVRELRARQVLQHVLCLLCLAGHEYVPPFLDVVATRLFGLLHLDPVTVGES